MHDALRRRWLIRWSDLMTGRSGLILLLGLLSTLACVVYSAKYLGFESDRNALVSRDLPWNKRFANWQKNFEGTNDLVVVVDSFNMKSDAAGLAKLQKAKSFVKELASELNKDHDHFLQITHGATFGPRALRLAPMDQFKSQLEKISQADTLLLSRSPSDFLARIMGQMQANKDISDQDAQSQIGDLNQIITSFGRVIATPMEQPVDLATWATASSNDTDAAQEPTGWSYLQSTNDRLLFIRVRPKLETQELNALEKPLASLRENITKTIGKYQGIEAGVTGIDVLDADETTVAEQDSTIASIVSALLITALLIVAYHSWRLPLLAMIALLVGVAWAYGFTTFAIGHLQVLSVIFTVMLLGLGVAYAIHLSSRLEVVRHSYPDTPEGFRDAMRDCFVAMGPGIITGALTTAASFMTTIFTKFTGVAEMGLIAGVGILLCLLSIFAIFPALLARFKSSHKDIISLDDRMMHFFHEDWFKIFSRWPWTTIAVTTIITIVCAIPIATGKMPFDYDLMNLQPKGVASIEWSRRIASDGGQSIWSGTSIAPTLDEARKRTEQFRKLPNVGEVGGVGLLFPVDEKEKVKMITQVREKLGTSLQSPTVSTTAPSEPDLSMQLSLMQLALKIAAARQMPQSIRDELGKLNQTLANVVVEISKLSPADRPARLQRLRDAFIQWRDQSRTQVAAALDPSPLTTADLPIEILGPYMGHEGGLALEVYPNLPADQSPLSPQFLANFIGDLRTVDPDVTGVIVQIFESGSLILNSYLHAGFWALVIVFLFVFFDFFSILQTVMTLVPIFIAFSTTFGIMYLCGVKINAANIMVLPLMFGIGVDSGVHMLYRYKQNPTQRPIGLTMGTGKGITITTLTSIVGFGAMLFARHRGIASLGFVLSVGLGMTLVACLTVMPAWLELRQRASERRNASKI